MLEPALFAMLGFLVAVALAFAIAPSLWRRAEVLERHRLEAALPLTRDELQGEIDAVRADRAMAVRRFEVRLEAAKRKASEDMLAIDAMKMRVDDVESEMAEQQRQLRRMEERNASNDISRITQAAAAMEEPNLNDSDEDGNAFNVDALRVQASAHELEIERLKDTVQELRVQRREQDRALRAREEEISALAAALEDERLRSSALAQPTPQTEAKRSARVTSSLTWQSDPKPSENMAMEKPASKLENVEPANIEVPAELNIEMNEQVSELAERITKPRKRRSVAAREADQDALRDDISALAATIVNRVADQEGAHSPILQILAAAQVSDHGADESEAGVSLADRVLKLRESADAAE